MQREKSTASTGGNQAYFSLQIVIPEAAPGYQKSKWEKPHQTLVISFRWLKTTTTNRTVLERGLE